MLLIASGGAGKNLTVIFAVKEVITNKICQ